MCQKGQIQCGRKDGYGVAGSRDTVWPEGWITVCQEEGIQCGRKDGFRKDGYRKDE